MPCVFGGDRGPPDGNIVGMNSVVASMSSEGEAGSNGLGFAIPAHFAKRVADQLVATVVGVDAAG